MPLRWTIGSPDEPAGVVGYSGGTFA